MHYLGKVLAKLHEAHLWSQRRLIEQERDEFQYPYPLKTYRLCVQCRICAFLKLL